MAPVLRPLPKSIHIAGKRWFDRVNGNTYHTAEIFVDGVLVHTTEREYGYGYQFETTAIHWLQSVGYPCPDLSRELPRKWAERTGCTYAASVADVSRKKDL